LEALLFVVEVDSMKDCSVILMRSFKALQHIAKLNRFNFELAYSNNRKTLTELFLWACECWYYRI